MACCVPTLKKSKVFTQNQIYILKNSKRYRHKLVLDIDETLLHSTSTAVVGADAVISWVTDMTTKCLYIILRPYAREFILYMSQLYDIYFYSASCMRVKRITSMCRSLFKLLTRTAPLKVSTPGNTAISMIATF